MNSHRRLLIGWLQKAAPGFLAFAVGGCAIPYHLPDKPDKPAQPMDSASEKLTAWKIPFDGSDSRPVIVDGVLYVGSADGAVYALDSNTGQTKWRFQTGESLPPVDHRIVARVVAEEIRRKTGMRRVSMTPAVENGTVFIGSEDLSFYAIDAATGKKKWSYVAGFGMDSFNSTTPGPAPLVKDGTVYFVTEEGLHALDVLTGERRWLLEVTQETLGKRKFPPVGPILGEGVIFLATRNRTNGPAEAQKRLYAVDPESGKVKWVTSLAVDEGLIRMPLTTAKGLAFFTVRARDSTSLHAINAADGKVKWKFDANGSGARLLVVDNTIYFTTDKTLIAAELETGRQLWSFSADQIKTYGPDLWADDQRLYVTTFVDVPGLEQALGLGGWERLRALDRSTGREKWLLRFNSSADVLMIHDGVIYAGGMNTGLYALDPATGKKLWSFKGPTGREVARLISGNRVFLISNTREDSHGYLYAIDKPAKFRRQTNKP